MTITIDGKDYKLPASLEEITLQQRIDYEKQYGKELREKLTKIFELKNENEKELCLVEYKADLACKTIAFFGSIPLQTVQQTHLSDVMIVYGETMHSLSDDVDFGKEGELQLEIFWNKDTWIIHPPELKQESDMSFAEFIDAKQMVQNMSQLGMEKWGSLLPLCCIYLRKKGEKYTEVLLTENGERWKLMQSLPLKHALQVGFFLSSSMDSFLSIFRSSGHPKQKAAVKA